MAHDRRGFRFPGGLVTALLAVLLLQAGAAAADRTSQSGPVFLWPAGTLEMSEKWRNRPIAHEDWAKGADIAVTLDQHLYPALVESIRRYAEASGMKIAVREGTCGVSAGALSEKSVEMAGFCCPPGKTDRFPGVRYHTVAVGALAIFVHPDNPIDSITLEQARQIYQGTITRWSALSTPAGKAGPDLPIKLVARLHCKNRPGHWRPLLDNEDLFSVRLHEVGSIQDVLHQVAGDPMAIGGFETLYMAAQAYPGQTAVKPLKIDGFSPADQEALARGDYPLYLTYNIASWEKDSPRLGRFIEFLIKQGERFDDTFHMVPARALRQHGWQFAGDEVIGEPQR